jgi:hypothetical protein
MKYFTENKGIVPNGTISFRGLMFSINIKSLKGRKMETKIQSIYEGIEVPLGIKYL